MTPNANIEPVAISVDEFTRLFGEGKTRTFELIKNGELQTFKSGRRRLILMKSAKERAERLAQLQRAA